MKPIISIVSGTFNRLPYLQRMVESARNSVYPLPYEFVLVDGGSTDGTQDWCREQPDIRLIEHGELRGAIRAFSEGARRARGEYVVLANDDIMFNGDSITRAYVYLLSNPDAGAVAFLDNRRAPGYATDAYKVQTMRALTGDGTPIDVPYAQVGMFPKRLGDAAGWWGDEDLIMREGRTYGGDNYLSARIWEMGFSVDAVEGVSCDDSFLPDDDLRRHNYQVEQQLGSAFYRRYPNGATLGALPRLERPQTRNPLRILYMPIYENSRHFGHYKWGLREALERIGMVWEVDYLRDGYPAPHLFETWQPHLVLTQIHAFAETPPTWVRECRAVAPSAVWVNWNGDVYLERLVEPDALHWLRLYDLQTVVNGDALPIYEREGVVAAYWQNAWEPVDMEHLPTMPAHDVVFLGNNYSPKRVEFVKFLKSLPYNVGGRLL